MCNHPWSQPCVVLVVPKSGAVQWRRLVSVFPILTCNCYYDVLRRAALPVAFLDHRVLDFPVHVRLCGSCQHDCLLAAGLCGCSLRTKCILSGLWDGGRLDSGRNGSRSWQDLRQEMCGLCRWGCGGGRCCYGYSINLLRLQVIRVTTSCHSN